MYSYTSDLTKWSNMPIEMVCRLENIVKESYIIYIHNHIINLNNTLFSAKINVAYYFFNFQTSNHYWEWIFFFTEKEDFETVTFEIILMANLNVIVWKYIFILPSRGSSGIEAANFFFSLYWYIKHLKRNFLLHKLWDQFNDKMKKLI